MQDISLPITLLQSILLNEMWLIIMMNSHIGCSCDGISESMRWALWSTWRGGLFTPPSLWGGTRNILIRLQLKNTFNIIAKKNPPIMIPFFIKIWQSLWSLIWILTGGLLLTGRWGGVPFHWLFGGGLFTPCRGGGGPWS